MQPLAFNFETVSVLAAERGIDTTRQLAEQSGVSRWVLYKAKRSGTIYPSHAAAVARTLGVPVLALTLGAGS